MAYSGIAVICSTNMYMNGHGSVQPSARAASSSSSSSAAISDGSISETMPPIGRCRKETTLPSLTTTWPPWLAVRWLIATRMSSGLAPMQMILLSSGAVELAIAPSRSPKPEVKATGRFFVLP
ncbi:hypothetical protein D3C87_1478020 [compost metagenome]